MEALWQWLNQPWQPNNGHALMFMVMWVMAFWHGHRD